ncbi:MAG: deacetylase [Fibrobacteres bacterium]|nr:deacetylase [Fibrobacterota bacterium]
METYLCITIDTECDHTTNWSVSNPVTYHSVLRGVPDLLHPIFMENAAVPTYLLTNEVLRHEGCVQTLSRLPGRFELGTHLHADYVEPQSRITEYPGAYPDDFQIDYPPEVEYGKLATLTGNFEKAFGRSPKVFRAGRFAANGHTIQSLERLGYVVDTSVSPHMQWPNREGKQVDYRAAPTQPYRVAPGEILRKGSGKILEVPITVRRIFSLRSSVRRLRPSRPIRWLRPFWSSTEMMKKIVDNPAPEDGRSGPRILNMMFHSMEVIPDANPYTHSPEDVRRFLDSLGEILRHCRDRGVKFTSLEGVAGLYA